MIRLDLAHPRKVSRTTLETFRSHLRHLIDNPQPLPPCPRPPRAPEPRTDLRAYRVTYQGGVEYVWAGDEAEARVQATLRGWTPLQIVPCSEEEALAPGKVSYQNPDLT